MDLLYKYYSNESEYAVSNFQNSQICFTPLESLNDPFEGVGAYSFQVSDEEQSYFRSIGSDLPKLLSKRISEDLYNAANFRYRVFCATVDHDNPLMWAYYANSHRGFCVGYEKSDLLQLGDSAQNITYTNEIFSINECEEDSLVRLLFQKSEDWQSEKEFRILYKLTHKDVSILDIDKYFTSSSSKDKIYTLHGHVQTNNLQCFCSDKYIIKKCTPRVVYLGMRMPLGDKKRILDFAVENKIPVYQMTHELNRFKFTDERII